MSPVHATPFFLRGAGQSQSDLLSSRSTSSRVTGIVRFDGRELTIEWSERVRVAEAGPTRSRTYEEDGSEGRRVIPLAELQSAELRGRWLRPRLEIVTSTLAATAGVPGARTGRLVLRLSRQDWALAQELRSELRLAIAEAALRAAERSPELPRGGPGDAR